MLFERIGYLRAAGKLRRMGYINMARKLEQKARDLQR
jgi:hypothetical protein